MIRMVAKVIGLLVALSLPVTSMQIASAKAPPPGAGADNPVNIMLMLDVSGSMGWSIGGQLYRPFDIAVDSSGNVYVSEYYRHRISKYNASGTLLQQWGSYGSSDGRFRYPRGIAVDSSGNVYVADYYNRRIQKFSSSGTWQQTIGKGTLSYVLSVAVDSAGNVYGSERSRIRKFNSSGTWQQNIGSYGSGNGQFRYAYNLAIDSNDRIYVADLYNHRIQLLNSSGTYLNQFGSYGTATGQFRYPIDVEIGKSSERVYVLDYYNNRVQRFDIAQIDNGTPTTSAITWGRRGSGDGEFYYPYGMGIYNNASDTADDEDVFVASFRNNKYQRFDRDGTFEASVGASNRLEQAKKVIRAIVSDSEMVQGADFGLITWNHTASRHTCISRQGANLIKSGLSSITAGGGTNLEAATGLASDLFNTSCWPHDNTVCTTSSGSTPYQKNFMIIISDGVWYGHGAAKSTISDMYSTSGVKTFVIGFMLGGGTNKSNYEDIAKAGDPDRVPDAVPLYAESWEELYEKLSAAIKTAIDERLEFSFTSPVTMPSLRKGNYLYRSHFIYHKGHQWEGHLSKYALDFTTGQLREPPLWDAGEKLDSRNPDGRKIFTVWDGAEVIESPSVDYNNFTTDNVDALAPLLYPTVGDNPVEQATNLINFVRGYDAYDEDEDGSTADQRWKLGDIYNSEVAIVGAPEAPFVPADPDDPNGIYKESHVRAANSYGGFVQDNNSRMEVIYAGSNDGMLHAFSASDVNGYQAGEEMWAFIPPSLLGRLSEMDVASEFPNTSASIYAVDGTPVVKDICMNGCSSKEDWRTVLLSSLGRGGNSYFALDITDPTTPSHLFTIENQPGLDHKKVLHWDSGGTMTPYSYASGSTIEPEYDYSLLGESWSTPRIINLPVTGDGNGHWVAVFGSGYNQDSDQTDQAALYVMDLENSGQLLFKAELDEISNSIINNLTATPTLIDADSLSEFKKRGAIAYIPDIEGSLWKVDLSNSAGDDLVPATGDTARDLPATRVGKIFRDNNDTAPDDPNVDESMNSNTSRLSYYGAAAAKGVYNNQTSLWLYYGTGDWQNLFDLNAVNRVYGFVDPEFPGVTIPETINRDSEGMIDGSSVGSDVDSIQCPPPPERGWYATLEQGAKVTDAANVRDGVVYVPVFLPDQSEKCSAGSSQILGFDMFCGTRDVQKELGPGIVRGGLHHRGQTYYSLSGQVTNVAPPQGGWAINQNVIVSPPPANRVTIDAWREDF